MIPHFAFLGFTSCLLIELHPFPSPSMFLPSYCISFPVLPLPVPFSLLMSQWISCLSVLLLSLVCKVTLEVCDKNLPFQVAIEGSSGWRAVIVGGQIFFFLAEGTAVNQMVKVEVFLSSRHEWISLSSVATQKS